VLPADAKEGTRSKWKILWSSGLPLFRADEFAATALNYYALSAWIGILREMGTSVFGLNAEHLSINSGAGVVAFLLTTFSRARWLGTSG